MLFRSGTDPMQEHECITFPGTVEISMDGYAQVRLLDRQAVKGLRVIEKEDTACKKSPSA